MSVSTVKDLLNRHTAFWNRILQKKSLIILGPVTKKQLDMMVSRLSPCGLWLDLEVVTEDQDMNSVWKWSLEPRKTQKYMR